MDGWRVPPRRYHLISHPHRQAHIYYSKTPPLLPTPMPVTVTIEDREKKAAKKDAPPPAQLDDYVHPNEKGEGTKALLLWLLLIFIPIIGFAFAEATRNISIGLFVWWLISCVSYFFVGPRLVMRRLRVMGNDIRVTAKNQPRLKAVLAKGSGVFGVDEPEAYLLAEGISQVRIFGPPSFIILTQAAVDLMQPAEVDVHLLRMLAYSRQNHVRRFMLLKFLQDTPAPVRFLVWPVGLYAFLLRLWWTDLADMTADRLVLLLVKNHKLIQTAMIKQHAATDPLMGEHDISSQDVDNYIEQAGLIGLKGSEISTQYKLGQAIHENPFLEARLQELVAWAKSPEFEEAVKKLAEARAAKGAAPAAAAATGSAI